MDDLSPTNKKGRALQTTRSLSGDPLINDFDQRDDDAGQGGYDGRSSPGRQPTSILKKKNSANNLKDYKGSKNGQFAAIYD